MANGVSPLREAEIDAISRQAESDQDLYARRAGVFSSSLQSGAAGMQAGVAQYGADLIEGVFGKNPIQQGLDQFARDQSARAQGLAPEVHDYRQVLEDPSKAFDYFAGITGQNIPNLLAAAVGAGVARPALRGLIASPLNRAKVGAAAGAFLPEAGETAMGLQQDPVAAARPPLERVGIASGKGAINAFLETLGAPASVVGRVGVRGQVGRGFGQEFLRDTFREAGTEGVQTLVEHAALGVANPERDTSEDIHDVINSMVAGGLLGGGISTAGSGVNLALSPFQRQLTDAQAFGRGDAAAVQPGDTPEMTATRFADLDAKQPDLIQKLLPGLPLEVRGDFEATGDVEGLRGRVQRFETSRRAKVAVEDLSKQLPKLEGKLSPGAPPLVDVLQRYMNPEFRGDAETLRALPEIARRLQSALSAEDPNMTLDAMRRIVGSDAAQELFTDPEAMTEELVGLATTGGNLDVGRRTVASFQAVRDVTKKASVFLTNLTPEGQRLTTDAKRRLAREIDRFNTRGPSSRAHQAAFDSAMQAAFGQAADFVRDHYTERSRMAQSVYEPGEVLRGAQLEEEVTAPEEEFGALTEQEKKPQYRFKDRMRALPFPKGGAAKDVELTRQAAGTEPEPVSFRKVVEERGESLDVGLRKLLAQLADRDIKDEALIRAREKAQKVYEETGDAGRALDEFEVLRVGEMMASPFEATDEDLKKMRTLVGKVGADAKETLITFYRKAREGEKTPLGKKFQLSAESMWKTWVAKHPGLQKAREDTPTWRRRMFMEAFGAVMARDDIIGTSVNEETGEFQADLPPNLLIDRETETRLRPEDREGFTPSGPRKPQIPVVQEIEDRLTEINDRITELTVEPGDRIDQQDNLRRQGELEQTEEDLIQAQRLVPQTLQRLRNDEEKTKANERGIKRLQKILDRIEPMFNRIERAKVAAQEAFEGPGVITTETIVRGREEPRRFEEDTGLPIGQGGAPKQVAEAARSSITAPSAPVAGIAPEQWKKLADGWRTMLGKYFELYVGEELSAAQDLSFSPSTQRLVSAIRLGQNNGMPVHFILPHEAAHGLVANLVATADPRFQKVVQAMYRAAEKQRDEIIAKAQKYRGQETEHIENNREELLADFFALWFNGDIEVKQVEGEGSIINFFQKLRGLMNRVLNTLLDLNLATNGKYDALITQAVFRAFRSGELAHVFDEHLEQGDPLTLMARVAEFRIMNNALGYIRWLAAAGSKTMVPTAKQAEQMASGADWHFVVEATKEQKDISRELLAEAAKRLKAGEADVFVAPFMLPAGIIEGLISSTRSSAVRREGAPNNFDLLTAEQVFSITDRMREISKDAAYAFLNRNLAQVETLRKEFASLASLIYSGVLTSTNAFAKGHTGLFAYSPPYSTKGDEDTTQFSRINQYRSEPLDSKERQAVIDELIRLRGPDIEVAFDDSKLFAGKYTNAGGKRHVEISSYALEPQSVAWHEGLHDFMVQLLNQGQRGTRNTLLEVANHPQMKARLHKLLDGHPEAQRQVEEDPEEALAYMFQFWAAGVIRITPEATTLFHRIAAYFRNLLGILSASEKAEAVLAALHGGRLADQNTASAVLNTLQLETLGDKITRVAGPIKQVSDKMLTTSLERLVNSGVPAFQDIAMAFHRMPGQEKGEGLPFLQRRAKQVGVWLHSRFAGAIEGTTEATRRDAIESLQTRRPAETTEGRELATKIRSMLDDMYGYMSKAGVADLRQNEAGKWEWEGLGKIEDYFPRMWDPTTIRANRAEFLGLMDKYVGADAALGLFNALSHSSGQIDLAETESDLGFSPWMQAVKKRGLPFITKDNAHEFSKFYEKDLVHGMSTYINQAAHRAEYTRSFGNNGKWIQDKLEEGMSQGASPTEAAEAQKAVRALEGTLGVDMNPELRRLFSSALVYENLVLLPFALFSSLIDPLGIAVRTGDINEAWGAFKTGLAGIYETLKKTEGKDSLSQLARAMGIIDNRNLLESAGELYNGMYMAPWLRKVNGTFFRLNGMELWNRRMRVAATGAGMRFAYRHARRAESGDAQAVRYMKELGLSPDLVFGLNDGTIAVLPEQFEEQGMSKEAAKDAAEKVQNALFKFVDSSILRPTAAHRPIWGSDPMWMLVFHLKQFTFSFNQVIMKRVTNELQHGNAAPMWMLASYVPFMVAADMLRGGLTGTRAGWDMLDWITNGVQRSGVLGQYTWLGEALEDANRGTVPGASFLGPTAGHAIDAIQTLTGSDTDNFRKLFFRSLPAGQAVKAVIQ